jgi:hypothetical protein
MPVERTPGGTSLIDVLDRVLDKGIVIDAWVRVSLVGIDLVTVEARVVVASIDTYLRYAEAMGITAPVARPPISTVAPAAELSPAREELIVPPGAETSTETRSRRRTVE